MRRCIEHASPRTIAGTSSWPEQTGAKPRTELLVDGRCECSIAAGLRAPNFPRRRADGVLTPDLRGALQTDDGATILCTRQGFGLRPPDGVSQLVGAMTHVSDDERYIQPAEYAVCTVAGIAEPRASGARLDVVLDVSQIAWQQPRM